jgi:hypothetical protein
MYTHLFTCLQNVNVMYAKSFTCKQNRILPLISTCIRVLYQSLQICIQINIVYRMFTVLFIFLKYLE